MSVSSMANLALNRRNDIATARPAPGPIAMSIEQNKAPPPNTQTMPGATLASISAYIPTEVITLYVAAIAALGAPNPADTRSALFVLAVFFVLTPVIVWLVYAGKVIAAGKSVPTSFSVWPVWEMTAATVSFATWGAALPDSPIRAWVPQAFAGVLIVVVSGLLGLIAPIVQRPLNAPPS